MLRLANRDDLAWEQWYQPQAKGKPEMSSVGSWGQKQISMEKLGFTGCSENCKAAGSRKGACERMKKGHVVG